MTNRTSVQWMVLAAVTLLVGLSDGAAFGQAGIGQRMRPWQLEGQWLDAQADFYLFGRSETENDDDLDLTLYKARGRARLDPEGTTNWQPSVGADLMVLDIGSSDPLVPDLLTQQRFGIGASLGEVRGWRIDAVAGAGYAGDTPYNDWDAVYAHATLSGIKPIDETSSWMVALNWDGNRTIVPDMPLPSIAYNKRFGETLDVSLGLPVSQVKWTPTEKWEVRAAGLPVISMNVIALYKINRAVRVYGSFNSETTGFQPSDRPEGDRIFFEQRRLEAGFMVGVQRWMSLRFAGGYAFDQQFSDGWHIINTKNENEIDNAAYVRLTADLRF